MSAHNEILGLGIESSCDETSAAVVRNGSEILSNVVSSQIDLHSVFYGVVPEIASRAHLEVINGLVKKAMHDAGITFRRLSYISATNRPGLIGSLLIGFQSAKAISYLCDIPLVAVNHCEAHLYAPFLEGNAPEYPFIGLLVSGGNTALYLVEGIGQLCCIGRSTDDAVGEAYDKIAKLLKLGYPGGPIIEKMARRASVRKVIFPKVLTDPLETRFSYSGLKTAVVNYVRMNPDADVHEIVFAFQERALELLVRRVFSAARSRSVKRIVVAGGVASNGRLRELLLETKEPDETILIPSPGLCTDNAAMVGAVAYHYAMDRNFDSLQCDVSPRI